MPDPAGPAVRYRHAFIVTYGRSGSTLLQGMLNALPGYLIRGENYDCIRHLEVLFNRLPRFAQRRTEEDAEPAEGASEPKDPFFGFEAFNDAEIAAAIGTTLDRLLLRDADADSIRCLGFKEVRYAPDTMDKRTAFLRRLYPGCALIYNIRDPARVVQSEFQKDKEVGYIAELNAQMTERAAADPHAFLVRYEDVARGEGTLIGLHEFLGERFNPLRVDEVLAIKHSYSTPAAGQFYSNFPRHVEVTRGLRGVSMLIVDRFDIQAETVRLGGLLLAAEGAEARRFATLLDEQGRTKQFRAVYDMASPGIAKRLGNEAAAHARFEFSFNRGGSHEYRLYLDRDELAVSVRAPRAAE